MSLADISENAILRLIFNATAWANYADNAAASPQTSIAVALHTADPNDNGTMSAFEIAYQNYVRVNVARTTGGWTVSGSTPTVCNPVAAITFPIGGATGSGLAQYFSTGKTGAGAQPILFSGSVTPEVPCGNGVTPSLSTATEVTLD